jgi:hypothetical protein
MLADERLWLSQNLQPFPGLGFKNPVGQFIKSVCVYQRRRGIFNSKNLVPIYFNCPAIFKPGQLGVKDSETTGTNFFYKDQQSF